MTEKSKTNFIITRYSKVDNKVLWKKGIAKIYDSINPEKLFSYIGRVSHAPKFVTIKKQTELIIPLSRISLNLKYLIQRPRITATDKDI